MHVLHLWPSKTLQSKQLSHAAIASTPAYLVHLLLGKLLLCFGLGQPFHLPTVQSMARQTLLVESTGCSVLIFCEQPPLLPSCHCMPQPLHALLSPASKCASALGPSGLADIQYCLPMHL